MTKYFIIIAVLVVLSALFLTACVTEPDVVGTTEIYEISSDVHSLDVEINAAEFEIIESDEFSVESNLKNLTVKEENGVLTIVDKTKVNLGLGYSDAELKLYIPENTIFESAKIKTGASKLDADTLCAKDLTLNTGAGKVEFDSLVVTENASVKGGAGEIVINDGALKDLSLSIGAGKLTMTSELKGESDLSFGVGKSDITLIGDRNDYQLNITTGVGVVTVDDTNAASYVNSGNGENVLNIKGGVGSTDISFK